MTALRRFAAAVRRLPARGVVAVRRRPRSAAAAGLLVILVALLMVGELALMLGQPPVTTADASTPTFTIRNGWTLADLQRRIEAGDVSAITAVPASASLPAGELLARTRDGQVVQIDLSVGASEAVSALNSLGYGHLLTSEAAAIARPPSVSNPSSPLVLLLPVLLMAATILIIWRVSRRASGSGRDSASRFTTIMPVDPAAPSVAESPDGIAQGGTKVTLADVAGCDEAKLELTEAIEFLRTPERFRALGARIPRGIMLYGPPGTGKTMLARAVAAEASVPFHYASGSEFVEKYVGVGAKRIRDLFAQARKHGRGVIFFDEFDAIGKSRGGPNSHEEREQTLNQLLVELDGFASGDQVVVMGASNRLQDLDPALLRPGRFDRQLLVAPPDRKGREAILHVHTRAKPLSSDVQLDLIARQTSGLTGADLANIANEAAILAGRREAKYVSALDFDNALERVVAGLQQKKVLTDKERRILAYHEAGHALMSHLMGEVGHLQKVTIVSRGTALGYTLHLPNEDRYLESKEELIDMLKIALAGRAAEQVVFGRVTNGAASDLEKVTEIARAMVFEWGMSDIVTSRTLRADNYALSEETKRVRDSEQAHLTDGAYTEALRLIEKHRASLDRLSQALLEKETLMREEVLLLLTDVEPESRASETVGTPRAVVSLPAKA